MKRVIVLALLFLSGCATIGETERSRPIVGAIRWDAWSGGAVTKQVEKTLSPQKYHDRLPWFAEVIDDHSVKFDDSRQDIMEREIAYASGARLDYWAFLIYPESSSMSSALKLYLKTPNRKRINFCLILHSTLEVSDELWQAERRRAIALLKEPGYQTVLDGRPLVYAYDDVDFPFDRFHEFLVAARKEGLEPYCVYMGSKPSADFNKVSKKGFDAVSSYAKESKRPRFSDLVSEVEWDYWHNAAIAEVPYVPLVTTGWDKRPRKDNPVSWETGMPYHRQRVFPTKATPAEISSHLFRAIAFVRKRPQICHAQAIIIYAWNEYDEGGWIAPTRGVDGTPDTSRLDAIRSILKAPERTHKPKAQFQSKGVPID